MPYQFEVAAAANAVERPVALLAAAAAVAVAAVAAVAVAVVTFVVGIVGAVAVAPDAAAGWPVVA